MKRKKGNADRLTAGAWWSRNRWSCVILAAALVLFIVDTVALVVITFALYDSPMGKLVDFLLHIWAIVELVQGVRGSKKLKALPPAEEPRNVYTGPEL